MDNQPTVLLVIDTAGPGGAETVFAQLAARMPDFGFRCVAVIPREDWLADRLRQVGVEPVILNSSGSFNVRYLGRLSKVARSNGAHLIHAHLPGSAVYGALCGAFLGIPVVATLHGPTDLDKLGRLAAVKHWLLSRFCGRLVAVSRSTADAMEPLVKGRESSVIIHNGVDTSSFTDGASTSLRAELALTDGALLIGAVGNIRPPKSYDVLLRAAALVVREVPQAIFAVAGSTDGQLARRLLDLRNELKLEKHFHFLGLRNTDADFYQNLDIYVSSSSSEGLPMSFLEAMACGRAMVATASGGAQEIIKHGIRGLLVDSGDHAGLSQSILRLLRDRPLRSTLAKAGRDYVVENFSLQTTLRDYANLYANTLSKSARQNLEL
ncbi:MAG: glycosyltransferase family 4 protein [Steroidobacteraceae bacterium]